MWLSMKSDDSVVFDGLMIGHKQWGCDFTVGHSFVRKPFKGNNPCHTHNFQEFLAWYGGNPDEFGASVSCSNRTCHLSSSNVTYFSKNSQSSFSFLFFDNLSPLKPISPNYEQVGRLCYVFLVIPFVTGFIERRSNSIKI
jgi:hypothetical protein